MNGVVEGLFGRVVIAIDMDQDGVKGLALQLRPEPVLGLLMGEEVLHGFSIQVRGEQVPGDFDSGHQFRGGESVEIVNLDIAPGILHVELQVWAGDVRVQGVDGGINCSPDLVAGRTGDFAFKEFPAGSRKVGGL